MQTNISTRCRVQNTGYRMLSGLSENFNSIKNGTEPIKKNQLEMNDTSIKIYKSIYREPIVEWMKPRIKSAIWNIRKQNTQTEQQEEKRIQRVEGSGRSPRGNMLRVALIWEKSLIWVNVDWKVSLSSHYGFLCQHSLYPCSLRAVNIPSPLPNGYPQGAAIQKYHKFGGLKTQKPSCWQGYTPSKASAAVYFLVSSSFW